MPRCFNQTARIARDIDLASFDAYPFRENSQPSGSFDRQNREVRYWQIRSSLLASTSTLVRCVITSKGPSRAGVPVANATTRPDTASTNATSGVLPALPKE